MTLVSSIITDAYRESNMLPLGKAPTDNQSTEALRLLNQILSMTYGGDAGEPLVDWPLGRFDVDEPDLPELGVDRQCQHHPGANRRLLVTNPAATTVFLPMRPQDGARMAIVDAYSRLSSAPVTLDGNGRTIEGVASIILDTDGIMRDWLYRADLGAWKRVSGVALTDDMPFPVRFDVLFSILLAMRLNPRYGRTLDGQSAAILKQAKQEFVARYLQSAHLETDDSISWPFLSKQSFGTGGYGFSSTDGFNRGRPF